MAPDDGHVEALTHAANELVEEIQRLRGDSGQQLVTLAKRSTRTRAMVLGLAVSLVVDVVLTLVLWQVAIRANDAKIRAEQAQAHQVATCESSNEARKAQTQLWGYILSLPPTEPRTKEQDKRIADFKTYINRVFAPRDCSQLNQEVKP